MSLSKNTIMKLKALDLHLTHQIQNPLLPIQNPLSPIQNPLSPIHNRLVLIQNQTVILHLIQSLVLIRPKRIILNNPLRALLLMEITMNPKLHLI